MSGVVSNNIFAALQKKKKSNSKTKDETASNDEPKANKLAELEKTIFSGASAPAVGNWADDDDDEWGGPVAGVAEEGWNQVRLTRMLLGQHCPLILCAAVGHLEVRHHLSRVINKYPPILTSVTIVLYRRSL